jgi:DNA-directed RNA polymerase III subunit RPC6
VYTIIDEASDQGAWSKNIKTRANIHDAVFTSAIKHLETKRLITTMKSVEFPMRKMYILTSRRPSERATGGPWFSDGELDEVFIDMVMKHLFYFIREKTFHVSKKEKNLLKQAKRVVKGHKMTAEELKAAKKSRESVLGPRPSSVQLAKQEQLEPPLLRDPQAAIAHIFPLPASYTSYPTLDQCTYYIENLKIFHQTLTAPEISQLLEVMIFDNRIEKIKVKGFREEGREAWGYKAKRQTLITELEENVGFMPPGDGGGGGVLSEVPCGRCPVFDLCEEGGPVGPSTCVYWGEWLEGLEK